MSSYPGHCIYFTVQLAPQYMVQTSPQRHHLQTYVARFANGYCWRVGGKVRVWAKLCTCLMGNVLLITWRSFVNLAHAITIISVQYSTFDSIHARDRKCVLGDIGWIRRLESTCILHHEYIYNYSRWNVVSMENLNEMKKN